MNKPKIDITNLKNCIDSLAEAIKGYKSNTNGAVQGFIEDSCVKRFEFTAETSWKTMKRYLKEVYDKSYSINR